MDDLKILGAALTGPEPPAEAIDRSRNRLQNVMRGSTPKPRNTRRWVVAGSGLMAAAAAAAVAVPALSTSPPTSEPVLSGRQVMLAAATASESKPASSGTYWHTKLSLNVGKTVVVSETWTRRDGRTWISAEPGLISPTAPRPMIRGTDLDYARIQRLPTSPDQLKSALLGSAARQDGPQQQRIFTINLLQEVLAGAPAPPKVRAAAFRALAGLPKIANLGKTGGGYRLKISYMSSDGTFEEGTSTVIVDPKTTRLRIEGWTGFGGGGAPHDSSSQTSGWTDRLPGRIVPWSKQIPYIQKQNAQLEHGQ
jgi:hypothetical protein